MEGFTPTFVLEVLIALCSGLGSFFAMRENMKTLFRQQAEETRLREQHAKADDESFHDIRETIGMVSNRVAVIEGRLERAP
ncbi:MAG TPA: hypothetical protein VFA81_10730 [Burkholderiales bacterium]|nr:hypothetical protein [Burkholderiales bacterium]